MRTRWFNFLVLLSLVLGLLPVTAAQAASETTPVAQPAAQAGADIEVESALRNQLAADETTGYLIYFKEKPDLSPAYKMDWIERGRFVANTLNQAALRSQRNVRAYLDAQGIAYKAFWIQNVISVESSNRATVNRLLTFPEIEALRQHRQISLVEPQKTTMAPSAPQAIEPNILHVLADQVWAQGYTGEGIVVASVDTGVRYTHQALVNHYRGNQGGSFNHNYSWWDPYGDHPTEPGDDNGHGSHTMGTMVGDDGGANQIGMAPGAKWMACRGCSTSSCGDVELLECAQFFAAPWDLTKSNANPDMRPNVVNNSWGDCSTSYDPWYQDVVDAWHAAGIYPVFSNGNASNCGYSSPPGLNTVGNPARYGNVTGVGSTGRDNGQYAPHSNWGPTDNPDTVNPHPGWANLKPQVLAPGVNIRSSINSGDSAYEGGWGGTSMSAPHVTGLIALMWQAAPCLVGDYTTTETILENTATPIPYDDGTGGGAHVPNYAAGWGEINALAAVEAAAASCGDSTIAGQVTNSATSAPVAGATVWATSTTDQRKTASDANGFYALNVFSDTYTLTASRYGYQTRVIPGVGATTGATTTQNIVLTPAAYYEVSGQVTDAATGWPLYAHIRITGDPFDPVAPNNAVWTDPATGAYSVMLAEGITYTFQVAAWAPGYNAAPDDVGPLTTDATANFALQANTGTCTAPGYYFVDGMMANFEDDAFPPAGWTVVNNGGSCEWAGDDPGGNGNLTGGTGKFAVADSDACGSGTTMNTDLISPPFDVSGLSQVNLSFAYDYNNYTTGEVAAVDVSANGGATWVNVVTWTTDQRGPATFSQNVTALLAGSTQARVRFHYLAPSWDWWWEVDDVVLGNPVCVAPTDGGLVVGNIYDGNYPTVALNGATVVNAAGGKTTAMATPLDVAVDDAFYTLFAPSGAQVFTATLKGYHPDVATVTVLDAATVEQDFQLPAGLLVATPDGVAVTVELGFTDNATLNLGNTGGAAATFELKEHEGRFAPIHIQAYTGNLPADDALVSTGLAPRKAALTAETSAPLAFPLADAAPAFAIDLIAGELGTFMSDAPGVWTTIGGIALGGPFAGDFLNGDFSQMYVLDYDANTFYTVDMATGVATAIGPSVPNGFWTGMAGSSDGTLYAASTTGSQSYLYTIDPATGAPTLVGEITNAPIIIAIAVNADGQMYGVDIGSDVLVAIDPATGAGTVVGSTGFSANYAQGMDFEEESGVLYWAAYGSSGELRIIDTATGASTSVGAFPGGAEVDCLAFATGGAADVPWLAEAPVMGSVPAAGNTPIGLDFDAAYVDQPGEYHAELIVQNDTPYGKFSVPVTMTVTAPQSWGKLTGTVTGLGVCDGDPAPLEEAEVRVESATTGQTWMVKTDVSGTYHLWIDQAHSPLTVTVTAPDYFGETGGVMVQQGQTTVVDFDLRILLPCLSYNPADFDVTLPMGDNTVEPLALSNTGAVAAEFELFEIAGGLIPLQAAARSTRSRAVELSLAQTPATNNTPATWMPMGDLELAVDDGTAEDSIGLTAGGQFLWLNRFTPNPADFPFHLDQVSIIFNDTVNVGDDIQLVIWQDADGDPSNGAVFVYAENATVLNNDFATWNNYQLAISPVFFGPGDVLVGVVNRSGASGLSDYPAAVDQSSTSQQRSWIGIYSGDPPDPPTLPPDSDFGVIDDFGLAGNWTLRASGATGTGGGAGGGIPWLTETPVSSTIASDADAVVDLTFDAGVPETMQPGTYYGELKVDSNAANDVANIPVTLTVTAPATWGKVAGVVTGLGPCDDPLTAVPLEGAEVTVESATQTWTRLTDATGGYALWLDESHSPVTITVVVDDYVAAFVTGVSIISGTTTVQNLVLSPEAPCLSVTPADAHVTLSMGMSTTVPIAVVNTGAGALGWKVKEADEGFQILAPSAGGTILVVNDGGGNSSAANAFVMALQNLGYAYSLVSSSSTTGIPAVLTDYAAVLYAGQPSTGAEANQLVAYLDAGGRLLVADNDFGYYMYSHTLYTAYFQATYGADSGSDGPIVGADIMAGINTDISSDPYPDNFSLNGPDAVGIFANTAPRTNWAGSRIERNDYRAVYLAWDFYYAGGSTVGDPVETDIVAATLGWLVGSGVPWLDEDPTNGTVAPEATAPVTLTFDASVPEVTQPGDYYAVLTFEGGDGEVEMPVTMTVEVPATWGKLEGLVQGLGYCNAMTMPLEGAVVFVESTVTTDTWGIEAGADGIYGIWLDEMYSPLTVTIAYEAGYGEQVFTGVEVVSGTTTILDANLLWLQPCVMVTPDALSRSVPMGTTATAQMNLDNLGAVSSAFLVNEANLGFDILGPLAVGGPDAFGYQYADSESAVGPVYGFVDISDVGTPVAMGDNTFVEVPIGFGFKFYGTSAVTPTLYNSVFVNSNGFLSFGAGSTDISPDPLPDPTLPNNLIAVAWDDLKPGVGGTVHVESFGQCPYNPVATTVDACFIAQYTNFVHADDTPAGTFEVILFHTGSILMQYAEVDAPDATTGIEAPLGLDGLDYGAALTDELAICFAYPGEWLDCQSSQVPWLTVEPTEGDVAVGANLALDVTFDAGVPEVSEPGVYKAMLTIITEDPMTPYHYIPVTMTVAQPATMAKLEGVVTGWSQCDAVSATLAGAQVAIATSSGDSFVLTADAVGAYGIWLDLGDTYTVTASHAGYVPVTVVGTVAAAMPPLGVELRADMPCIDVSPTSYDVTLPKDRSTTRMFTIDNTGAGDFAFNNILGSSLWLSVLPKSGVVPADSSVPVTLTFDATGLVAGSVYSTVLEIVHTDPDVARLLVRPVRLTVLDAPQVLVEVVKTVVPADFVLPGELLTYTVVFTNSYDMPLDLTATDPVPANTTYVLGSVSGAAVADPPGNVVTWAGSLEAGASATFSLVVRVNDDVALGTMITNTVTVTANAMPFTGQAVVRVGRVMHTIYLPLVQRNAQ